MQVITNNAHMFKGAGMIIVGSSPKVFGHLVCAHTEYFLEERMCSRDHRRKPSKLW